MTSEPIDPESKAARGLIGPREWSRVIDEIERPLREELAAEKQRVRDLREQAAHALAVYGEHDGDCAAMTIYKAGEQRPDCTCGFVAAKRALADTAADVDADGGAA